MIIRRRVTALCLVLWALLSGGARPGEGATTIVAAGADLQAALNAAQPGDVILLAPGATFTGNFVLPVKSGAGFITIRSAAPDSQLPGAGVRITPAFASRLPKIQSPNTAPALRTVPGTHHWRLMFLEFPSTQLGYNDIIRLGDGSAAQSLASQAPFEIELDRVYVHGHPLYGQKRGIAINGRALAVRNSHVSDIKAAGMDAQAIAGWNGPGPFTIENNYLEASGENFLLGGSDPAIPALVPANLIFRHNHVARPMSWREPIVPAPSGVTAAATTGGSLVAGTHVYRVVARRPVGSGATGRSTPSQDAMISVPAQGRVVLSWQPVADATSYSVYVRRPGEAEQYWTVTGTSFADSGLPGTMGSPAARGDVWRVKNLFELKNARGALIEYNVFENNWQEAQIGYAVLFTPRNQDGACPWCVVEDVTFQFNIVRNTAGAISVSGYDSPNPSAQTNNIRIRHNLVYAVTQQLGGTGWFLLVGDEPRDLAVDHNTIDTGGSAVVFAYGGTATAPRQITGFSFTNNAARHNAYGINGASAAWGNGALAMYFPDAIVQGNWFAGGSASRYPAGNYFGSEFGAAFVNAAAGDYRCAAGSPLIGRATDGSDIGANLGKLLAATAGVIEGTPAVAPQAPRGLRILTQ
jgi:hypothetical protein